MYNRDVSAQVQALRRRFMAAAHEEELFTVMTDYYKSYGYGVFAMNRAFRIGNEDGKVTYLPISNIDGVMLDDLLGYEFQKTALRQNTEAFLEGKAANNVLLYGDAGTGKSTSVKAILNEYYDQGLRMIEIYKHQFGMLSSVIARVKNRNYRFMIFIDDLSFEEHEVEYKFLKAVIEGGVETKPDNVLICATSNRRHLIQETWNDRKDMEFNGDVHRSDTMEEKLSLASRFGITIYFGKPDYKEYIYIARTLAKRHGLDIGDKELEDEARRWELRHGSTSGRTAAQLISWLKSSEEKEREK
jgi:predicted AAA+ superfamily ATPase